MSAVTRVSFVIATRNRREVLLETLAACELQKYAAFDIHVVDDGSSDGTYDAVRRLFPEVVVTCSGRNLGSIASRNRILARARGDILFGLDDDSRLIASDAVSRVVARFEAEPDLGLIEFQEQGPQFPKTLERGGLETGEWHVPGFASNRYALRRSVLEKTGIFFERFWHMYEEPDLAVRIWDAGYRCLRWNDIVVWHDYSALNRNDRQTHYYQARNELLSNWMRSPIHYVVPLTLWKMLRQLHYSLSHGWGLVELRVWRDAVKMLPLALRNRRPVTSETLRRCLLLGRRRVYSPESAWAVGRRSGAGVRPIEH